MGDIINIGGVKDQFYRYKMPRLRCKTESSGNGVKTLVENFGDIALSLKREPTYIVKYFGYELGALTREKEGYVNGKHDQAKLSELVNSFIEKFVLCGQCRNPETHMNVTKKGFVRLECLACGGVTDVDPREKLVRYIVNHPPADSGKDNYQKLTKQQRRMMKQAKADGSSTGASSEDAANLEDVEEEPEDEALQGLSNVADQEEEEIARALQSMKTKASEDDWAVDTSAAAVAARQAEEAGSGVEKLLGGAAGSSAAGGAGEPTVAPDVRLKSFLEETSETSAVAEELMNIKKAYGPTMEQLLTLAVPVMLKQADTIPEGLVQYAPVLKAVVKKPGHQKGVLYGIEALFEKSDEEELKLVPTVLHSLYDSDVLEEEYILKWHNRNSTPVSKKASKRVKQAAESFVTWLEEADEESSDDED